jgi:alpha-tubulin suppressor-like RCC1 family protein
MKFSRQTLVSPLFLEKLPLPAGEEGVQVACGQLFSLCLTLNGRIIIWGSLDGNVSKDNGFFYEKPTYALTDDSIANEHVCSDLDT